MSSTKTQDNSDIQLKPTWQLIKGHEKHTYQLSDEPEVIHIIKTGTVWDVNDPEYFLLFDDAYGYRKGEVVILKRSQILEKYGIDLTNLSK